VDPTAVALADALRRRETSAVELAQAAIARLQALEPMIGAVAAVDPARSLADAARCDANLAAGGGGPLEGVPITIKDWIDTEGWPIAGSVAAHRARRPTRDATAVARLRAAGAVVVAITSALADSPAHGATRNPRDPTRAPGGSSSGAAAVVAAGASPIALGSDSGGSIRLPAAWCGVFGLKPSFGRVPLTGHFPRLGSLSDARTVIGPLATSVDDLALVLGVIEGPDGLDAGVDAMRAVTDRVPSGELRIGHVAGVAQPHVHAALTRLRESGATIADEAMADPCADALDLTRRYWRRHELTGDEYHTLLWDWDRFRRRMLQQTQRVDALVLPATSEPAPLWRESIETDYLWQLPWSLTGSAAVVVPTGTDGAGLPLAVQIVAPRGCDGVALDVARRLVSP
jgi:amidase